MDSRSTRASSSTMTAPINKAAPLEKLLEVDRVTALEAGRVMALVMGQAVAPEADLQVALLVDQAQGLAPDLAPVPEAIQEMEQVVDPKMEVMAMEMVARLALEETVVALQNKSN